MVDIMWLSCILLIDILHTRRRALFVQPKYAKLLNTTVIQKAMGELPVAAATIQSGEPIPPSVETKNRV